MMWFLMMLSTTFAQQAQGQKPTISVVAPQVTKTSNRRYLKLFYTFYNLEIIMFTLIKHIFKKAIRYP